MAGPRDPARESAPGSGPRPLTPSAARGTLVREMAPTNADDEPDLPAAEAARARRRDHDAAAASRAGMRTGLAKQFKQVLDGQARRAREATVARPDLPAPDRDGGEDEMGGPRPRKRGHPGHAAHRPGEPR